MWIPTRYFNQFENWLQQGKRKVDIIGKKLTTYDFFRKSTTI
jgi:hypothetical protein